jgi:hypothetical protein
VGDERLCRHYGATLVAVRAGEGDAWRKELGIG